MQRTLPDLGPRGEGWVAMQGVILAVIVGAGTLGPVWGGAFRVAGLVVGVAICGAGAALALWGALDLGQNLTAVPRPKDRAYMVDRGAYRIVRHPIYGGLILGAFGWGLATASPVALAAAATLGLFFDLKSRREEGWLMERYAGYGEYRSRTRKMVPWIY